MTDAARIVAYNGHVDGLRFGLLDLIGESPPRRRFLFDRLSGIVRLWRWDSLNIKDALADDDPDHLDAAKALLTRLEPLPKGIC